MTKQVMSQSEDMLPGENFMCIRRALIVILNQVGTCIAETTSE